MKSPATTTVFAGVDGRTEPELPTWYETRRDVETVMRFAAAMRELPRATETTVSYEHSYTGEWVETEALQRDRGAGQPPAPEPEPDGDSRSGRWRRLQRWFRER